MPRYLPLDATPADLPQLKRQAASLYALRRMLGLTGLALPAALLLYSVPSLFGASLGMQPSISHFYHTHMGDVLVGALASIGMFLIGYKGYDKRDFWVTTIAGIAALCVALFPTTPYDAAVCGIAECALDSVQPDAVIQGFKTFPDWLHGAAATAFFLAITVNCWWLFPMDGEGWSMFREFSVENAVYAVCGLALLVSCVQLVRLMGADCAVCSRGIFIWETVGILAFATAWLWKGRTVEGIRNLF